MRISVLIFLCIFISLASCMQKKNNSSFTESIKISVTNPLDQERRDVLVLIPESKFESLPENFNKNNFVVMDGGKEIPSQFNSVETDTQGVAFVLDQIGAKEKRNIEVLYNPSGESVNEYARKTQAELSHKTGGEWKGREYVGGEFKNVSSLHVPPQHKDHSWYLRYEGPGWESDKVGYRFYLDQRNAVDVFGKLVSVPVLQNVGQDNFDSYHEMQPWGMDIMKVGKSLGLGSVATFHNGSAMRVEKTDSVNWRILENGILYASFQTTYSGWQIGSNKHDLKVVTSIHAGTRLTSQRLDVSNSPENISTGIGKDSAAVLFSDMGDDKRFGYLATYGKQSLNNDELGLAVFFDPSTYKEFDHDEFSHIVKLTPSNGTLRYYFLAAWVREPGGIKNQKDFEDYIKQTALELAHPLEVVLANP